METQFLSHCPHGSLSPDRLIVRCSDKNPSPVALMPVLIAIVFESPATRDFPILSDSQLLILRGLLDRITDRLLVAEFCILRSFQPGSWTLVRPLDQSWTHFEDLRPARHRDNSASQRLVRYILRVIMIHGDTSKTLFCGDVSEPIKRLVKVTEECFDYGISVCKDGTLFGKIGKGISEYAENFGYGVVDRFVGLVLRQYFILNHSYIITFCKTIHLLKYQGMSMLVEFTGVGFGPSLTQVFCHTTH